jgi:mRNA-degrading endonuclease toxin of MazEF toxin-antitoxin module
MSDFKRGDIILANFPYTDKEEVKTRPVLVISTPSGFIWGLMMTSQINFDDGFKYELNQNEVNFPLNKLSLIRCNVIQTIDKKIVKKKLGAVTEDCIERIMGIVKNILAFEPE